MSFVNVLQAAQAQSLSDKLNPTEISVYEFYCREYSKTFHEPLSLVFTLNPEDVARQVYAEQLADWDKEERLPEIQDLVMALSDPEYDTKKERALREEMRKIVEDEEQRLLEGRAVHESLEKKKTLVDQNLPAQGGLSSNLIRQMQHSENEG